ncbi:hypothetical protein [Fodinibius saliphilus]|uniref:hypothetical protein n=1 Tax=Fodinibius saliphilus TaxID=1920650 RepID=UPI0011097585|nr:hypothetical protein [Fodinibius saliphilus]
MSKEEIIETVDEVFKTQKREIAANIIKAAFERLVDESKWFTSIGLALLGFFTALLVQLKLAEIQPLNFNAIVALLALIISLGSGFWIKLYSMKDDIVKKLKPVIEGLVLNSIKEELEDINGFEIEEISDNEIEDKKGAEEIIDSISNSLPSGLIIIQGSTLFISVVSVFIYLMHFILLKA